MFYFSLSCCKIIRPPFFWLEYGQNEDVAEEKAPAVVAHADPGARSACKGAFESAAAHFFELYVFSCVENTTEYYERGPTSPQRECQYRWFLQSSVEPRLVAVFTGPGSRKSSTRGLPNRQFKVVLPRQRRQILMLTPSEIRE